MDKISLSKAFSNHFIEFLNEMTKLFPKNVEIRTFKTAVNQIKRINPSKLIKTWYSVVTKSFKKEIYNEDFNFFEDKDYSNDLKNTVYDYEGMYKFIDEMKKSCRTLSDDNKKKTMKYLSNLTKMTELYHS
tara:strand:+ start:347 stop:739 length:393 start_codon:yes stop_codon:yes gene_type:complete